MGRGPAERAAAWRSAAPTSHPRALEAGRITRTAIIGPVRRTGSRRRLDVASQIAQDRIPRIATLEGAEPPAGPVQRQDDANPDQVDARQSEAVVRRQLVRGQLE